MTLPNFLIIGASKSGTTTLHYVLSQHPDIYMCPEKEPGFFWAYGSEIRLQGPGMEKLRNRLVVNLEDYQKLFNKVSQQKAIGEASVRYLTSPRSPELIHRFIPQAKLIAILRQPADRAYSAFLHNQRDGIEPCRDFAQAIVQEQQGMRDDWMFCRYLDRGFYAAGLKRYLQYFDRQQMHISLFEDLKEDSQGLIRNLFEFLGVDSTFDADTSHRHNVSGIIRNPILRLVWTHTNRLRSAIRPLIDARLRHAAFEWVIQDLEKPNFPPELRAELTAYYRQDIEELQELLQRDLSHWLK